MLFSQAALATCLLFSVTAPTVTLVHAATGAAFSYDPEAENGPANWSKLEIDGNQCGGSSNSPIAVYTRACDRWGNYEFQVCFILLLKMTSRNLFCSLLFHVASD
jgi:carbonic anhydrase